MEIYPLKFEPIFKQRIWGGQKLKEFFGKSLPAGEKIGESWELADLPEDKSLITNGQLKGQTLAEAIAKYPEQITGDKNFPTPFPLLIKFLDAQNVLSVQVHPDIETCKKMGKGDPKTECWYIIDAEPDAVIYKGQKKDVTKEQFAEAIKQGNTAELLQKIPVKQGQCYFLPAGTSHAIGAGLLIAEIQMPSDTTYRVFDWNRLDKNGNSRPLHIEEALESIHFGESKEFAATTVGRLVDCELFKIDKGHQAKNCEMLLSAGKMKTLIILSGSGIISNDKNNVEFKAGDTMLIPFAYEGAMQFVEDTQYLLVTI